MAFQLRNNPTDDDVFKLEREFPSVLRPSRDAFTKTHQEALSLIEELASNKFIRNWSSKCRPAAPLSLTGRADALKMIRDALHTVELKMNEGCWYPPMQNGVRIHVPLAHFLIAPVNKGEGLFSPFLHFYFQKSDSTRISEYKAELLPRISAMVLEIGTIANLIIGVRFWEGAFNLLSYWRSLPEEFVAKNPLLVGKASSLFTAVEAYAKAGGWVPDNFICPDSPAWGRFRSWVFSSKHINLP